MIKISKETLEIAHDAIEYRIHDNTYNSRLYEDMSKHYPDAEIVGEICMNVSKLLKFLEDLNNQSSVDNMLKYKSYQDYEVQKREANGLELLLATQIELLLARDEIKEQLNLTK